MFHLLVRGIEKGERRAHEQRALVKTYLLEMIEAPQTSCWHELTLLPLHKPTWGER